MIDDNTETPPENEDVRSWFQEYEKPDDCVDVRAHILAEAKIGHLETFMISRIPSCYISEGGLVEQMSKTGLSAPDILKNKLPDTGAVMAGDFGEVLTLFYLGSERPEIIQKVMKWRFKQDRTKAAPHSDVVILHRSDLQKASTNDFVICAEAKLKSTKSTFSPIEKSIEGYNLDKTGRLARTLVWLKEKEIEYGDAKSVAYITRFSDDLLDTAFNKYYRAVVIIDREYIDEELDKLLDLPAQSDEFEIIVLGISDLKALYEKSFEHAIAEVTHG